MKECQQCKNCYPDDVSACPKDGQPTVHTIPGEPVLEGKYQLECRLGQGGMGVVYKARHAYLKTQLAIKVILPDLVGNDPQLVTRFRQEALAAAAIRHQNVVGVTDYGVIDGTLPFLVMEYVEGESLHDMLQREKKLSPEVAFEMMQAVCSGVGAAHHQGIVHRDLKPLNIMICNDRPSLSQGVKILDFGLAKIKSGELLGSFIQAQTTGLMGSPYYMAPEQWADEEPDSRSDIYSLGVMMFQMLSGDVPFKGSSIPGIMKKHISDPPPTFAQVGLDLSPDLERAVMHTLKKDKNERTPSVEVFVEELSTALLPMASTIHTSLGPSSLPVSSLRVVSRPPESAVFVDNISVGRTTNKGELLLEGLQSGNHHLRISHNGFKDWLGDVVCDGEPKEVVAELRQAEFDSSVAIPMPDGGVENQKTLVAGLPDVTNPDQLTGKTVQQSWERMPDVSIVPAAEKSRKGLYIGIGALMFLLVIGLGGVAGAYMMGWIGKPRLISNVNGGPPPPSPGTSPGQVPPAKNVLVGVPGGTFMMGSDAGLDLEKPAHSVIVKPFKMDKTEVTNAEYYSFVAATSYPKIPAHWVNGKPVAGEEMMPVRYVNIEDVKAFADWRSKRDGVSYRLPTEEEWEFAARNGSKDNKYPWGDEFKSGCAVVDKESTEPERVGSVSCPDEWGIDDLIGNVYEWTGSLAATYPGSKVGIKQSKDPHYMIRGGSALNKSAGQFGITATFRIDVESTKRDKELGFRLVTDN
ncbi:MAG: SUMF1/EgtB/PvdO family nonheme iron enzyme [Acidobacteria bacterium]|nr:SUMF1/EgtB/PvdO family nonheme iron enzyme [Acidobacteriota bacterium]